MANDHKFPEKSRLCSVFILDKFLAEHIETKATYEQFTTKIYVYIEIYGFPYFRGDFITATNSVWAGKIKNAKLCFIMILSIFHVHME